MLQVMLDLLQGEEEEAALNRMNEGASWDSEEFTAFTWFYHSKDKTPAA